jgi:tripartite-type tricarboxylate transporter receptor subunit TctC
MRVSCGSIGFPLASSYERICAALSALGDAPTVSETVPDFVTGSWQGLLAPANTPKPVIDKLHSEIQRIVGLPDVRERLSTLGAEANNMNPQQFKQWLANEMKVMEKVVKDGKVTVE